VGLCATVLMLAVSCSKTATLNETAYVVPEKLKLKSSTAQATRVIGELKTGDRVTITARLKSEDGTPWVNIKNVEGLTGWAETRYFVKEEIVNKSRQMAEEIRGIPTQGLGKSKATLKLRLTPDRTNDDNVATTLPSGTAVEIVARDRKPRPASVDTKSEGSQASGQSSKGGDSDVKYDSWFQVRLKDYAVLPAGWIYGGSVELDVPGDIIYFVSSGRKIMGWLRLGTVHGDDSRSGDHYLVMERKTFGADDRADFDRVKVLAYDPSTRNYNTPFRDEVLGRFPVKLAMNGQQGTFALSVIGKDGQKQELEYIVELLSGGKVKVTKPNVPKPAKKGKP
ncbi:MAG: hypothetical protein M3X11_24370, partial [Acidobacteriota bacterium]|nr:hypothetical protein [Acidobacteriota bacterium]